MGNQGSSQLQDYIFSGNVGALQSHLEEHPKECKPKVLNPLLFYAVMKDKLKCVECLVEKGADVNTSFSESFDIANAPFVKGKNMTCLHLACLNVSPHVAKCLMDAGASPEVTCTLLELNTMAKEVSRPGITPMMCCLLAENYSLPFQEMKKNRGACFALVGKAGGSAETKGPCGLSMMHMAARMGDDTIVRLLLSRKFPVDLRDENAWTTAHHAADGLAIRIAHYMDRDVKSIDEDMRNIGRVEKWHLVFSALAASGADFNERDNEGFTVLHRLCFRFSYQTAIMAFKISSYDYARALSYTEVYRALLELGADDSAKTTGTGTTYTPLELIEANVGRIKHRSERRM